MDNGQLTTDKEQQTMNDLKFAFRQLLKNPGFTAVAVLTLALGIGANTAIFSVVNGVLLKPLPYLQPGQLVNLWEDSTGTGLGRQHVAGGVFLAWKEQSTVFENLSVSYLTDMNLIGDSPPERIAGAAVSANYLQILRAKALIGRVFLPDEDKPGQDKVVVLSHNVWQQQFGGVTNLVGQAIKLGDHSRTVIGVLPPRFLLSEKMEFLIPFVFGSEPWSTSYEESRFEVIARLKPGFRIEDARSELQTISERLKTIRPSSKKDWSVAITPMHEEVTGKIKLMLWTLSGAVGFVLLIACANVANLLLARSTGREREMAIRAALGAGRWQIARQLLTESASLSILGCLLGLLFAFWGIDALSRLSETSLPRAHEVRVDARVLGFSFLASLACALGFGLMPALRASVPDFSRTLKEGGRVSDSGSLNSIRGALVVTEVALALVLLAGAGLLLHSFIRLQTAPLGFDPRNALVMEISLPEKKYPNAALRTAFFAEVIERVRSLPGVHAAGLAGSLPFVVTWEMGFKIAGGREVADRPLYADYDFCTANYFRALGVPLIKGRFFAERDGAGSPRVVIVDQTFANRYFPNAEPLGQRLEADGAQWQIVGVVGNVRHRRFVADFRPRVYAPQAFSPFPSAYMVVRAPASSLNLVEIIRKEISAIDPEQPISNIRTLEQVVSKSVEGRRLALILLGIFAGVSLLLAAVGVYGVMAFSVSKRTHEIGVRIALGAQGEDVLRLVVKHGMRLTLAGVAIGIFGALALTRVLANQLYQVKAADPIALAAVSVLLIGVAAAACYVPARRATKVDPMEALRHE